MRPRILVFMLAVILAGCQPVASSTPDGSPGPTPAVSVDPGAAKQHLAAVTVAQAAPMRGYSRAKFPHWHTVQGACDTRETVLQRDGTGVTVGSDCYPTKGRWYSPYDGKWFDKTSEIDIDHMVPLANAWRSGAAAWTDQQREDFANDLVRPQLLAASATTNRAKGDQDPSLWKPPNRAFWCQYATRWVEVKFYWKLTVTEAEKSALTDMLGTC